MKYELTGEDKKRIAIAERTDPIVKFSKHKDSFRFNVGDILIKKFYSKHHKDGPWVTEAMSSSTEAHKKFVYAYEDENGIGYIKQVLSTGKLSEAITPMTNFDPDKDKFELDPEYADHIMLADEGDVYKPNVMHEAKKKFREQAYRANKKLLVPVYSHLEKHQFLRSLAVGDIFWIGHSMDEMVDTKVEVTKITNIDVATIPDPWLKKKYLEKIDRYPELKGLKYVAIDYKALTSPTSGYSYHQAGKTYPCSTDFSERFVSKTQPRKMKEDCI